MILIYFLILLIPIRQVISNSTTPAINSDEIVPVDVDDYDESEPHDYEEFKHDPSLTDTINDRKIVFKNAISSGELKTGANGFIKIITSDGMAFLLNGTDLWTIEVDQTNIIQPRIIARLDNVDQAIQDFEAIIWKRYVLFVVALQNRYNIYIANPSSLAAPLAAATAAAPIERIAMHGLHQKIVLFMHNADLFCLIGNVIASGEVSSTLRLYKWRQSHFSLLQTRSTKTFSSIGHCSSSGGKEVLLVVKDDFAADKTRKRLMLAQVYVVGDDEHLRHTQNIFLLSNGVELISLKKQCLMLSTTNDDDGAGGGDHQVEMFIWDYDYLKRFSQRSDRWFNGIADNANDVVLVKSGNKIIGFNDLLLARPYAVAVNMTDKLSFGTDIKIFRSNDRQFLLLNDANDHSINLHCIEMQLEPINATDASNVEESYRPPDQCHMNLKELVEQRQLALSNFQPLMKSILRKDNVTHFLGTIKTKGTCSAQRGTFKKIALEPTKSSTITIVQLKLKIIELRKRFDQLIEMEQKHTSKHKRDTGTSVYETINVKNLTIANDMFKNVLLRSARTISFDHKISAKSLVAHQIVTNDTDHMEPSIWQAPILRDTSSLSTLSTKKIKTIDHASELWVKTINGIEWNEFVKSIYRKDQRIPIRGNIVLTKPCHVHGGLMVRQVNDESTSTWFTLNTAQTVTTELYIPRFFFTGNIETRLVNDIDFGFEIAQSTDNNTIEGPVKLSKCTIDKLLLSEDERDEQFSRHVVGTRIEDLSQLYTGKVTINGSLRLRNVLLDAPKRTKIFVNDRLFELNVMQNYWMKSVDQTFGSVTFTTPNISTPQLLVELLNDQLISSYVLINKNPTAPINLLFNNAHIAGNLLNEPNFVSTVKSINDQCIRRGQSAIISGGHKRFVGGHLVTEEFYSTSSDYDYVPNLVVDIDVDINHYACTKQFKRLRLIEGVVHAKGNNPIELHRFNGIDLADFVKQIIFIDEPLININRHLTFDGVVRTLANTNVLTINEQSFNDVFESFNRIFGENGRIQSVHVVGNLTINGAISVDRINGIVWNEYVNLMVTPQSKMIPIEGQKTFKNTVRINRLYVDRINAIPMNDWFTSAVHRAKKQIVQGKWNMNGTVKVAYIAAPLINGIALDQLIDTQTELIEIHSDLLLNAAIVTNDLNGLFQCDLREVDEAIAHGSWKKTNWKSIQIDGDAYWPAASTESTPINRLVQLAVNDWADQQLLADVVTFTGDKCTIKNGHGNAVDSVDLVALSADALLKSAEFQSVHGVNHFTNELILANVLTAELKSTLINAVNILHLNRSMVRRFSDDGDRWGGKKIFQTSPHIYELLVQGKINGIDASDMVVTTGDRLLPPITFYAPISISIVNDDDALRIDRLNDMPFDYFMENRMRQKGNAQELTGSVTYQNLIVKGQSIRVPQINDIHIEDIVPQSTDALQEISGHKRIYGNVSIDGPAMVTNINGVDVVHTYLKSIFVNAAMRLGRLELCPGNSIRLEHGVHVNGTLNGISVDNLIHWSPTVASSQMNPLHEQVSARIEDAAHSIDQLHTNRMQRRSVRLEYATDVRIVDGKSNADIDFIVDTCRLQSNCSECVPQQNDIRISESKMQIIVHKRSGYDRTIQMYGQHCNVTIRTAFLGSCRTPNVNATVLTTTCRQLDNVHHHTALLPSIASIGTARLFEQDADTSLLLINFLNGSIGIFDLLQSCQPIGFVVSATDVSHHHHHMDVLSWDNYNILLVFSAASGIAGDDEAAAKAEMFYFDGQRFAPLHGVIPGDFDRSAWMNMRRQKRPHGHSGDELIIWLTRTGTDVLTLFRADYRAELLHRFVLLQKIVVDGLVASIVPMKLDDDHMMVVVTQDNFLYMYKYNNLEGWIVATHGYFKGVETVVPFRMHNRYYLFVSMKSSSTALIVYH